MGRKKKINLANLNIRKAASGLDLIKQAAQTTIQSTLYPVTECLQFLKNMYTKPTYETLTITSYAWTKLMAYIHLVGDYEISGFGRIEGDRITDFEIIRQEVRSTYVESDADAVLEFIMKLPPEQRTEWTLDWHSHVNMGTTPSSTDWGNYSEMLIARQNKQFPAMIVNKSGNVTAYQIICDSRHTPINIKLDTTPMTEQDIDTLYEHCKSNVQHYCTKAVTYTASNRTNTSTYPANDNWYYNNYYDNDEDWYDAWEKKYDSKKKQEENENTDAKPRIKDTDLSYTQQLQMEEAGYVFDEETGEAYGEDEICSECGKPLKTETELDYGICFDCFQKAMNEEALAYHQKNHSKDNTK